MPLSRALALTLSIKDSFALKVEKKPLSMGFKESLLNSRVTHAWIWSDWQIKLLVMEKDKTNANFFENINKKTNFDFKIWENDKGPFLPERKALKIVV